MTSIVIRTRAFLAISTLVWVVPGCLATPHKIRSVGVNTADSVAAANLRTQNQALRSELATAQLDQKKLEAELAWHQHVNSFLNQELQGVAHELETVEQRFVSLDNRFHEEETKASAVALAAEARLLLEKIQLDAPETVNDELLQRVSLKLESCQRHIDDGNYAAAVYYGRRAIHIINQAERRTNVNTTPRTIRIVSVRKGNIRSGPSSNDDVVAQLAYGTVLVQIATQSDWYQVRTQDGKSGWVHKSIVH